MHPPVKWALWILVTLAAVPFALVARVRAVPSDKPRIHIIQDMDNQPKYRAQHESPLFADGRAMRPPVAGTVARGGLEDDDHYFRGIVSGQWAASFPRQVPPTMELMARGRDRFEIYCLPCHGAAGYGDGMVNRRAMELVNRNVNGTTWVQPKSLHEEQIRTQPPGQIFNSITNGIRNMPAYAPQIPVADRWAIVAYVKALQRSQNARTEDLTPQERAQLRRGR